MQGTRTAPARRSQRPNVVGSGTRSQPNSRRTRRRAMSSRSSIHPPPYRSRTTQTSTIREEANHPPTFSAR